MDDFEDDVARDVCPACKELIPCADPVDNDRWDEGSRGQVGLCENCATILLYEWKDSRDGYSIDALSDDSSVIAAILVTVLANFAIFSDSIPSCPAISPTCANSNAVVGIETIFILIPS